ncbi:MAG: class I SAM-dependent methyltransferase [Candidatus Dormibacteraeota bacterium]|uniref:Class I SAM-dependent methyltransferase n=1 Tax=Candidatus Amunia macphersoniae TaxID=3127014 RepID=A0A934KMY8_9BACT|nr:class I SAM-dependent methyltransferase [Candidatus Dormibacteraeota bacterium]
MADNTGVIAPTSPHRVEWHGWLDRWEAQQGSYMPDREERFDIIIDAVQALQGDAAHIVDLGAGPGSLARRLLDHMPGARVTAVDMDPVLLAIGRNALGDQGGRLAWLDADLRSEWGAAVEGAVDAAVSTTALHWLQPHALAGLYRHLAMVLSPGGVFVNGDRLSFPEASPLIAAAGREMRGLQETRHPAEPVGDGESWEEWWAAVAQDPGLAAEVAERARRHHDHPDHHHQADLAVHVGALRDAGFAEVETVWQHLTDRVLVAVR